VCGYVVTAMGIAIVVIKGSARVREITAGQAVYDSTSTSI
jgi:hypothetical protein